MTVTPAQAPLPQHVAPEFVVDFDFYDDPRFREYGDLHDGLVALMRTAPDVFWTPRNGGHWVLASHALIYDAARAPELFSSSKMSIPPIENEPPQIPISFDPPLHGLYRKPLMEAFAPRAMRALENDIRALAADLIDRVKNDGACDFVAAVGEPLPVMIFMKMMGMPLDRLREFREWVRAFFANVGDERMQATMNVAGLMTELIEERQKERKDDLISRLLDTTIEGRPVPMQEMQGYCLLLFIAGLDTVANAMAFAVRRLAHDHALQARLRGDPSLIPEAVEEMLRRYTFTMPSRVVAKDLSFGGVDMRAGERVLLLLPAADLDARTFPDPTTYDLERSNKTHLAFNSGPHRCVGSHLARIELIVLYEEWLARIPTFRPDPDKAEVFHGGQVLGLDHLPMRWEV